MSNTNQLMFLFILFVLIIYRYRINSLNSRLEKMQEKNDLVIKKTNAIIDYINLLNKGI